MTDKNVNLYGVLLVILGILVILVPWIIFPVCEMEGSYMISSTGMKVPMTCGWTARAVSGVGALIVVAVDCSSQEAARKHGKLLVFSVLRWVPWSFCSRQH